MPEWYEKDKIISRLEKVREGLNSGKDPSFFKVIDKQFLSPPLKYMDEKRKGLKKKLKKVV